MEEVYPPENFGASNHIPLKQYFENFTRSLGSQTATVSQADGDFTETEYLLAIKELMGVDVSFHDVMQLSKNCSPEQLFCGVEDTKTFPIQQPKDITCGSKLPSPFITTESNELTTNKVESNIRIEMSNKNHFWSYRKNYHKKLDFNIPRTLPDLQPGSEFMLSVLVYRPAAFKFFSSKNASEKIRFNHEILILGINTLTELRDAIVCSTDFGLSKEVESTESDLKEWADARNLYPSGFIFIDGVFYNDLRHPDAIDYSFPIIEWAKEKKILGLESRSMENVTIDSLTPRLGYPYLYMHQGDCEHLIIFADARLVDASTLHSKSFPHVLRLNRHANRMCLMCSVSFAKWICVGSDRLPQHKVFLCTDCCNAYNYVDGKKVGNFKLYPYYEKHVGFVADE